MHIQPSRDLGDILLSVEKPSRYVGGEYGILSRKDSVDLQLAISFPDLYEIGMSNQAIRILYNGLNELDAVSCDRVFAPAPDFEKVLEENNIPLYTLDNGIPLNELDILGFSMGYELGINGVLSILKTGHIPIKKAQRGNSDPIIILGGPAASNPLPYSYFADAVYIGEAEDHFYSLIEKVRDLKKQGAGRAEILSYMINESPHIWIPGKKAKRAVDNAFSDRGPRASVFPVSSMKIIQDHGAVEIMRGCPNGCRFCHAGIWYRPMRQKNADVVKQEVEAFISRGGYREITLSSLSTGDYAYIDSLIHQLNSEYEKRHISFQLPSLKVSSFSLPLLESISHTRKSGLTFAIETPVEAWQYSINKKVCFENVCSILDEAKKHGWRSAKFYFMIGLPVGLSDERSEEQEISEFILAIQKRTGIHPNVNIACFVPKPYTPYQWVGQLSFEKAQEKLDYIRNQLRPKGIKINTHDPFISMLEGILSRGNEEVGTLIEESFIRGCRLDGWNEHFRKDIWQEIIENNINLVNSILGPKTLDSSLAWDEINPGISKSFLKNEYKKSMDSSFTEACTENCNNPCGACNNTQLIHKNIIHDKVIDQEAGTVAVPNNPEISKTPFIKRDTFRMLFSFSKYDSAVFIPHLGIIEVFSKALVRSSLPASFTEGFNPLPKLDFASPISIGVVSDQEIASLDLEEQIDPQQFLQAINAYLPSGFAVKEALLVRIPFGTKKRSVPSLLWGFTYEGSDVLIPAKEEKAYRQQWLETHTSLFGLRRTGCLAMDPSNKNNAISYFKAYSQHYPQ